MRGDPLTHEGVIEDIASPYDALAHEYAEANGVSVEQAAREIGEFGLSLAPVPKVMKRISVAERVSKHRMIRVRRSNGKPVCQFNATKQRSWESKPKRRAKNKVAKQSRKGNR